MSKPFVLAHLSDPHLGPLPQPGMRELASKRLIGYINWRRSRHRIHRRDALDAITRDLHGEQPDHVAITGDLVNIALPAEFALARRWLETLGRPADVSVVPGNHDAYVAAAGFHRDRHWSPYMAGDDAFCGGAKHDHHRTASSSPPPCGEGLGVGVERGGTTVPQPPDPPPQPSPTRGEGVAAVRPPLNLAPLTPTLLSPCRRTPQAGRGSRKLPLHKLLAPIALRVEQRGEIAVVDPRGRGFRHQRLGSEGDAQSGIADH